MMILKLNHYMCYSKYINGVTYYFVGVEDQGFVAVFRDQEQAENETRRLEEYYNRINYQHN